MSWVPEEKWNAAVDLTSAVDLGWATTESARDGDHQATATPADVVTWDSMVTFWEFIKAQGVQTCLAWSRLDSDTKEAVHHAAPSLAKHLDALLAGYEGDVTPPT